MESIPVIQARPTIPHAACVQLVSTLHRKVPPHRARDDHVRPASIPRCGGQFLEAHARIVQRAHIFQAPLASRSPSVSTALQANIRPLLAPLPRTCVTDARWAHTRLSQVHRVHLRVSSADGVLTRPPEALVPTPRACIARRASTRVKSAPDPTPFACHVPPASIPTFCGELGRLIIAWPAPRVPIRSSRAPRR